MQGIVKSFLPQKQYGFIRGDDGRDYFFHASHFKKRSDVGNIFEGVAVAFDQAATPKGYSARSITLAGAYAEVRYAVPDEVYVSRGDAIKGWEVIDRSGWTIHSASRGSMDEARSELLRRARELGANAVLNMEYRKTTGSENGTGNGTHHFTIHNFSAQPVNIGRRSVSGVGRETLLGLNGNAERAKAYYAGLTQKSLKEYRSIWTFAAAVASGFFVWALLAGNPIRTTGFVIAATLLIGTLLFNDHEDHDSWLQRS